MTANSLPTHPRISGVNFRLSTVQAGNPSRGGEYQGVDLAEPVWLATLEMKPMDAALAGELRARLTSRRGTLRTMYVYDASWQKPLAYRRSANVAAWDWSSTLVTMDSSSGLVSETPTPWGEPRVTAINRATATLTVAGFAANAQISYGDYGHWDDGVKRRLHMVVEPAQANASGIATLTVEPPPPASTLVLPAPFEMYRASAEMVIVNWAVPFDTSAKWTGQVEARQILRRF